MLVPVDCDRRPPSRSTWNSNLRLVPRVADTKRSTDVILKNPE